MSSRSVQVATTVSFHRPLLMMLSRSVQVAATVFFHRPPTDDAVQASAYHCYCVLPQTPTDDAVSWEPLILHVLQAREDHYYSVLPQKPCWWCHQLRTTKFARPPDQRWLPLLCSSTDRSPQCGLWCWRLWTELFQARKQAAMPRLRSAQLHGMSGHRKCDKLWLHSIFSHRKCESFTMQQWMMMMMMMTTDDPMKVRFTSRFCLMKSQTMLGYCNYHRVSVLFVQMSKIFQVDNCLALRSEPPRSLPKWACAPVPSVLHRCMGWKLSHGSDGIQTHNLLACTPNLPASKYIKSFKERLFVMIRTHNLLIMTRTHNLLLWHAHNLLLWHGHTICYKHNHNK